MISEPLNAAHVDAPVVGGLDEPDDAPTDGGTTTGPAPIVATPAPPPPEVYVMKTAAEPISLTEEYVGQTEAVDTVEIRARVSGILEKQAFVDGSSVKQGDLLFVIDQQPFIAALAQAKATLAQATASHTNSKQNLERIRPLLADKAISQQDLDTAIAKEATDAANVEAARAHYRDGLMLAADAAAVTPPMTSPGICSSGNCSRRTLNSRYSASSSLHCHVSVSMGHWSKMLLAAVSRSTPVKRCAT